MPKRKAGAIPKRFSDWLVRQLKDANDLDKIDIEAHYDRELTFAENKTLFENRFGLMFTLKPVKIPAKELKAQETERLLKFNIDALNARFGIEIRMVE